jgi:hypothetical protein
VRAIFNQSFRHASSKRFKVQFIHKTPAPILARLERLNDWMARFMKMFCRMFIWRIIAAPDVTALHAEAKVKPGIAHSQTIFAALRARRNFVYQIQM